MQLEDWEFQVMLERFDSNGDGFVDYPEFFKFMEYQLGHSLSPQKQKEKQKQKQKGGAGASPHKSNHGSGSPGPASGIEDAGKSGDDEGSGSGSGSCSAGDTGLVRKVASRSDQGGQKLRLDGQRSFGSDKSFVSRKGVKKEWRVDENGRKYLTEVLAQKAYSSAVEVRSGLCRPCDLLRWHALFLFLFLINTSEKV